MSSAHLASCMRLPQPAVAADQGISGAVVCERRLLNAFQLGDDVAGQHLAQLHAPLIEGVDVPDGALREDAVLIECHERADNAPRAPAIPGARAVKLHAWCHPPKLLLGPLPKGLALG